METELSRVIDPGRVTGAQRKGRGNSALSVSARSLGLAVSATPEAASMKATPEAASMKAAAMEAAPETSPMEASPMEATAMKGAAGVGETYSMVETAIHAMAEAVAAVPAISTIGHIAVVIGIGGKVGTLVGRVGQCTVLTGVLLRGSRLPGKCRH